MSPVTEIRCSGLARPMNCLGFLFMKDLPPNETNDKADEGTACSELFTAMLLQKTVKPQVKNKAANGVLFDNDMYFYAGQTAEYVFTQAGENEISSEERIDWMTQSGIKIRGQYDISHHSPSTLYMEDLKYGWGLIDVKDNWQLIGYAIGKVIKLNRAFEKIVFRIHQPRPHHEDGPIRTWEISYEHLMELKEVIEKQMMAISEGCNKLQTGPHCKYCLAAGSCAAINKATYSAIDIVMSQMVQDHLTEKQLAHEFDILDRASELMKIRKDSIEQLIVIKLKAGGVVPNYTIHERFGHRKWKKSVSPSTLTALIGKEVTEQILMSPAKVQKLGVTKEFIDGLTEKYRIGVGVKRKNVNDIADRIFNNK